MTQYLVHASLASAQSRSNQQALANGCTGVTDYWWGWIVNSSTNQAALVIADSGPYSTQGLTSAEVAALQTLDPSDTNWFPLETGP
jgi:hypothetical protein